MASLRLTCCLLGFMLLVHPATAYLRASVSVPIKPMKPMPMKPMKPVQQVTASGNPAAKPPPEVAVAAAPLEAAVVETPEEAPAATVTPECTCLNWKETYSRQKSQCGWGNEFLSGVLQGQPIEHVQELRSAEYCGAFFTRINDNFCLNADDYSQKLNYQWCYVSESCNNLNGGRKVGDSHVSLKLCDSSQGDVMTQRKDLAALTAISVQHDISLHLLLRHSYPTYAGENFGSSWEPLLKGELDVARVDIQDQANAKLATVVLKSGMSMLFNRGLTQYPWHLVQKGQAYRINVTPWATKPEFVAHPSAYFVAECMTCPATPAPTQVETKNAVKAPTKGKKHRRSHR